MNKADWFVILAICILLGFVGLFSRYVYELKNPQEVTIETKPKIIVQKIEPIEVTITAYSPDQIQTDSRPFETASTLIVTPQDLWELKYVALSRDLMEEYGIEYGDVVYIGFIVEDTMNIRIKNTVDLFLRNLESARKFGRQTREIIILEEGI